MPTLTREQYNKFSAPVPAPWQFDINQYCIWGEKDLVRQIPMEDGKRLQVRLTWKNNRPTLRTSVWSPTTTHGVWCSSDFRARYLGDVMPRKNYKTLCKLAGDLAGADFLKLHFEM